MSEIGPGDSVRLRVVGNQVELTPGTNWARDTAGVLKTSMAPLSPEQLEQEIRASGDEQLQREWDVPER